MAKKTKKAKKNSYFTDPSAKILHFRFYRRNIQVLLDNVLIFRFFRRLHGRFWGLAGILVLITGVIVCFAIRRDLLLPSTAFSDFGKDVRTAPYFAGSVFFAAYGLWRWRNYLSRTLKRTRPILFLISLTIIGLYMTALFPVSWQPWPYRIHLLGVTIAGVSIAATVIFDILLSKTRKNQNASRTRFIKMVSFLFIIVGGWLTLGSAQVIGWFHVALYGEVLMLIGYALWIGIKTYQGEDPRSALSKQLKRIVLVS